jgi:ABC-2 type transport system permease protein
VTTTAVREPALAPSASAGRHVLASTGTLIRLIIRRERIKLPAWLLGLTVLLAYLVTVASTVLGTEENLDDVRRFMEGGLGAVFGPGYGRDDISAEVYVASVYGVIFFVLAALMSLLLVSRHTRAEEQSGRAELVRSNVVGPFAPLAAALTVALGANVVLALLLCGTMVAKGHDVGDGLLFGASVGAVGLVFAAISALAAQLTEYSRAATGIAGAVLGTSWVVRAAGDMVEDYGSPLSWLSPLAWSNQTRSFVDGRWWPLLLSVGLAVTATAAAFALSARRDLGAGLVAARPGRPVAAAWLGSPLAMVFRLSRSGLMWWTVALSAYGLVFSAFAGQLTDAEGISADRIEMFGGSVDTLVDGYLSVLTLLTASLASIMVVLGVQEMRAEEVQGRAEPVLATSTSRRRWFASYLTVLTAGLLALLLAVGLSSGVGVAISEGDGSYIGRVMAAHLAHAPGVLVMLGMAALLFGWAPKAIGLTWVVLGYGLFNGLFGAIADAPQWLRNLLPTEHTGNPPLDPLDWPALITLLVIAAGLAVGGLSGFARRNLEAK